MEFYDDDIGRVEQGRANLGSSAHVDELMQNCRAPFFAPYEICVAQTPESPSLYSPGPRFGAQITKKMWSEVHDLPADLTDL